MTRPLLILLAILLAFANFELWIFSQVDRTLERAESRRSIVTQDVKTKWRYQCYRTK